MAVDPFLQVLVAVAEQAEHGIGITLAFHGVLVSGDLTTVKDYAAWFDRRMKVDATEEERRQATRPSVAAKIITDEQIEKQQYVHLRNVRIVAPGGATMAFAEEAYWRGRLEDVNGFLIGRIGDQVGEPA